LENNYEEIGGPGLIVEIDESLFVRRKNNAVRILLQQWIFGEIYRETNACFIISVPDRSEKTLLPIIQKCIRPGSIIMSVFWKAYNNLQQAGFIHNIVNHTYNFVDAYTGAYTQNIERLWGSAKWGNKKRRGTNINFLESYLTEFMWRTRLEKQDAFQVILKDISEFWPPL
jgi:transposase-like protein